jgi:ATP-binding cassette subfamily B protein/subfamily B ATP-binding cassette protein MsbA
LAPSRHARILRYALRQWRALGGILAITVCYSAFAALQPWPLKILIDSAIGGAPLPHALASGLAAAGVQPTDSALVGIAAVASIVVFAVQAALDAGLIMAWSIAGQHMVYNLATDLFLHLQRLSLLFHARQTVGDSIERITTDSWCVYSITDGLLVSPAKHLMVFATTGAIAWQLDRELTLLMMIAVPAFALSAMVFGPRITQVSRGNRAARAQLTAFVQQVLGSMPLVQAFGAGPRNRTIFRSLSSRVVTSMQKTAAVDGAFNLVNGLAMTSAIALVVYTGGRHVLAGELSLGSLLVFIAYARSLQVASQAMLRTFASLRTAEASADRVLQVLGSHDAVRERPSAHPLPRRQADQSGRLEFDNVTFGYRPEQPVLNGISLVIAPGETLALVGSTGAGKSTLAGLIPRFYDPWQGRVLLDGVDLRDVRLASLRTEIALVLQESFILPLSVAENIAYGRPEASRDEIVAAAVAANAHEFVMRLPERYETVVGEQGTTLSGGQRQRINLARAFLREPRVLVMDEPTSALDASVEQSVMEASRRLMAGRTTLIIAHRFSTLRAAHRIAVMEHGRIVEIGTHNDLLALNGRYARLATLQAQDADPANAL